MKKYFISILPIAIFVLSFIACGGNSTSHSDASDAIEKARQDSLDAIKEIQTRIEEIYRDVFSYDFEGVYDYDEKYMSTEYKKLFAEVEETSVDQFYDCDHWFQSQDPMKPTMRILSVEKISTTEATANIVVTDSGYNYDGQYPEQPVKLLLVKEKGAWLVDDFITQYDGEESSEKAYLRETLKENKLAKVREQYEKLEAHRRYLVKEYQETLYFNATHLKMMGYIPAASTDQLAKYMNDILEVCRKEVELAENAHDDELLREAKATQEKMVELVN